MANNRKAPVDDRPRWSLRRAGSGRLLTSLDSAAAPLISISTRVGRLPATIQDGRRFYEHWVAEKGGAGDERVPRCGGRERRRVQARPPMDRREIQPLFFKCRKSRIARYPLSACAL